MKHKHILFASPPLAGHTNQLLVLAAALHKRGHRITFATGHAFRSRILDAGAEFFAWDPEEILTGDLLRRYRGLWDAVLAERDVVRCERIMWEVVAESYSAMHQALHVLFKNSRPDALLVDSASVPAMDMARQFNVPVIILAQFLGNHVRAPGRYPQVGTPYTLNMTFRQALSNRLTPLRFLLNFRGLIAEIQRQRKLCAQTLGLNSPGDAALMLVATAFGFEFPRLMPPHVQMVGPIVQSNPEPLPADLARWLDADETKLPTVFVSTGTLVTPDVAQAAALVKGLTSNDFQVLWSLRKERQNILPPLPKNFRIEAFVPQQSVLAHPNVKAFVSHCGMNSVSECLYYAKPILGLPLANDAYYNAARVVDCGVGLMLDKSKLDASTIQNSLSQILNENTFNDKAYQLSRILRHAGGLERAVQIVESVLEIGYEHLMTR